MWNIIHDHNPYEGFEIDKSSICRKIDDDIFKKIISEYKPQKCLEIGSWRGASAIHIAQLLDTYVYNPLLICVDTWLGSPEHFYRTGNTKYIEQWGFSNLRCKNGYPTIYNTFMSNVIKAQMQDIIIPFPQTSSNACIFFERNKIYFDFIYLDGAHDYESVLRDVQDCYKLLNKNGIILCDDYHLDSVKDAIQKVFPKTLRVDSTKCVVKR